MHHHAESGDSAVEDLNAKSLSAAKAGTSFTPPTHMSEEKPSHSGKPMHKHMSHVHHHTKPASDSSAAAAPAPAPDAAPADTSK